MHRALFFNWKIALLWAIGISASVAAFFSEGGGHEQLEASAQQIREKRSNANHDKQSEPAPRVEPSAAAPAAAEEEEADEPAFGEPMLDPVGDGEAPPKKTGPSAAKPAESEEEF